MVMKKTCSIIAGGKKSLIKIDKDGFVIACDKGYKYCKKSRIQPNLLIGDFDSLNSKIHGNFPIISLPKEKNDTDLMAAIKYAVNHNFNVINLYCALGGRLDHMLGNIQSGIYASKHGLAVNIYDNENEMHFLSKSNIVVSKKAGYSMSVLSLTDKCENVSIHGAKYCLNKAELINSEPIGISNEWIDDIKIEVDNGVLLVIMSKLK